MQNRFDEISCFNGLFSLPYRHLQLKNQHREFSMKFRTHHNRRSQRNIHDVRQEDRRP